ncbi:MAG: hypothetical protein ACK2UU_15060 [Anaerolineae bacterium]
MATISRLIRAAVSAFLLVVFAFNNAQMPPSAAQEQMEQEILPQLAAATASVQRLTIPAAAFTPGAQYYSYENHGRYLKYFEGSSPSDTGYFVAPVLLPQGATLSRLTFHYKDGGAGQADLLLVRHTHDTQGSLLMAELLSSDIWAPSFGSASTTNFNPTALIDNSLYSYYLNLSLPPGGLVWGCGVEIEYYPPAQAPVSSTLSMPPAAFIPFEDGYGYQNSGWNLIHNSGAASAADRGWYLAPVHLPDGATVTRLVFHWFREDSAAVGTAYLQRTMIGADTYQTMAEASSAAGAGSLASSTADTTITGAVIDNSTYAYWILVDLPAAGQPGLHVEGREVDVLYQMPSASFSLISVPAAAFRAYEDGYDFENHARHLFHKHDAVGGLNNGWYMAPVNLPDGVTVTKMTFYWYRNGTYTGTARLQRTKLGEGTYEDMAVAVAPQGAATNGSSSDTTIAGAVIDNSQYAYWLVWDLPAGSTATTGVHGQDVVIEFRYRVLLPLIRRQ